MSDAANNVPLEESDALNDVASLTERLRLAVEVINGLDHTWPHGLLSPSVCRHCGEAMPKHAPTCKARIILGV